MQQGIKIETHGRSDQGILCNKGIALKTLILTDKGFFLIKNFEGYSPWI
jgi:hypothetical protein